MLLLLLVAGILRFGGDTATDAVNAAVAAGVAVAGVDDEDDDVEGAEGRDEVECRAATFETPPPPLPEETAANALTFRSSPLTCSFVGSM